MIHGEREERRGRKKGMRRWMKEERREGAPKTQGTQITASFHSFPLLVIGYNQEPIQSSFQQMTLPRIVSNKTKLYQARHLLLQERRREEASFGASEFTLLLLICFTLHLLLSPVQHPRSLSRFFPSFPPCFNPVSDALSLFLHLMIP